MDLNKKHVYILDFLKCIEWNQKVIRCDEVKLELRSKGKVIPEGNLFVWNVFTTKEHFSHSSVMCTKPGRFFIGLVRALKWVASLDLILLLTAETKKYSSCL